MKKLLPIFLLALFMVPLLVSSQNVVPITGQTDIEITICNVLQIAKNIVAAIGLAIAIIYLIVSGIKYMTAGGDAEKQITARKGIVNSIIGIIIIVGALFIIALAQSFLTGVGAVNILGNPCTGYVVQ